MHGSRRRLFTLAFIMVALVAAVSLLSTWYLYQTSLKEQRKRLMELVHSQASLVHEFGEMVMGDTMSQTEFRDIFEYRLSRAHKRFQVRSESGEFTVAKRVGNEIAFLIVNGRQVLPHDPMARIPLDSPFAAPMEHALSNQSGTTIGLDYEGVEVLAAFTPLYMRNEVMGMVAKIDTKEIKAPFIRANVIIIGAGMLMTMAGLALFFYMSEPILREMRDSERQYRDLVENANSLVLRVDPEGTIVFSNGFADQLIAGQGKTLVGTPFRAIFDRYEATDSKGMATDLPLSGGQFDIPVKFAVGGTGWISWNIRAVSEQDKQHELLCIGHDITDSYLANQAQREMEERFRGIAKASPVGIIITDLDGKLLYANERMHELTGANFVEMAGRGWLDRIHRDERHHLLGDWFKEPGAKSERELRLQHVEGALIWTLAQAVELKNARSEVVGYVATFTDITALKEAERSTRQLTAAIDQAAEMVLITDLDGTITYVNPAFEEITGYSRQEAEGQTPGILRSDDHDPAFYKEMWEALGRGEVWTGRIVNRRKDGQHYHQDSTIGPIRNEQGESIGYVSVARDITEQLAFESRLRQSQKLESIGELAAGIAHEINTPTQYVTSNTQFLGDAFAKLTGMVRSVLEIIEGMDDDRRSDEMQRLVAAIDAKELDYLAEDIPNAVAESETGLRRIAEIVQSVKQLAHPGEMTKSYHDLNVIVRDAATVSTNEWKYVADVVYDLDETLPEVNCLKAEIGQVALNLIVNAAHAIEEKGDGDKGTITLKTRARDGYAVLEVTDSGTGMPDEVAQRVFDPFFTTKDVGKGTGQGLAIANNVVVNMHGGSIDLSTAQGEGTTFTIRLPLTHEESEAA